MHLRVSKLLTQINKMQGLIIKTSEVNSDQNAVNLLRNGGIIAIPTDTVYGLACSAFNRNAIAKLYSIKSRNENKPVAICVGREIDVQNTAIVNHLPIGLLNQLLPGPVTLVLKSKSSMDKSLVFNNNVAVRIPDYDFIRNVANLLQEPIALTSANVSNHPSTVNITEFINLWDKLDGIFDGGDLGDSNRGASTIIDLSANGTYEIIRDGIAYKSSIQICKNFGLVSKFLK